MVDVRARPRFFLGNFDFEHRIADPKSEPNQKLKRINSEMASTWLSIAEDGDFVWTPLPFDEEFITSAKIHGLPDVIPIQSFGDVPRDVECVPWGWSSEIRQLCEKFRWRMNAPTFEAVRLANSRQTSSDLEQLWNVELPGARAIQSLDDLDTAIRSMDPMRRQWVVKAEFGMSARERILGHGKPGDKEINWVRRRLMSQGVVFFEPWVDRISEIGVQIEVPVAELPRLIGITPIHVDRRGQYAGSWFAIRNERFRGEEALWKRATEVALDAAKHLQTLGYFGPLGIDAMIYRDTDGSLQIRPLQDINARWTMGRLSLGWKNLARPEEEGFWRHGADDFSSLTNLWDSDREGLVRLIKTSPRTVGLSPCMHATNLYFRKND